MVIPFGFQTARFPIRTRRHSRRLSAFAARLRQPSHLFVAGNFQAKSLTPGRNCKPFQVLAGAFPFLHANADRIQTQLAARKLASEEPKALAKRRLLAGARLTIGYFLLIDPIVTIGPPGMGGNVHIDMTLLNVQSRRENQPLGLRGLVLQLPNMRTDSSSGPGSCKPRSLQA